MNKQNSHAPRLAGFTIVELMVTVAIIAILTGIIVTNLTSSRAKARDAKRISDLTQLQLALELYFDRCKQYPIGTQGLHADIPQGEIITSSNNGCPSGVTLGTYISSIPQAPNGSNYEYSIYDPANPNDITRPLDYIIHTKLELPNEAVKDGLPSIPSNFASHAYPPDFACSIAPTSVDFCLSPK